MIIDCLANFKLEVDCDGIVISDARAINVKVFSWEEIAKILKGANYAKTNHRENSGD